MIHELPISGGRHALIDSADLHRSLLFSHPLLGEIAMVIADRTWSGTPKRPGSLRIYPYTTLTPRGSRKSVIAKLHRLIVGARTGQCVDHINGDTLDNRRSNLRLCTTTENNRNVRHYGLSSQFKGVQRLANCIDRWRAHIQVDGRLIHLGCFPSAAEAARAYDEAALKYFGEFARLNFPLVAT